MEIFKRAMDLGSKYNVTQGLKPPPIQTKSPQEMLATFNEIIPPILRISQAQVVKRNWLALEAVIDYQMGKSKFIMYSQKEAI